MQEKSDCQRKKIVCMMGHMAEKKRGTKATAASNEAGKTKGSGAHAQLSLTGLERMAKEHRALAKGFRERMKNAQITQHPILAIASEVHEGCAKVLFEEAEKLRGQP